MAKLVYVQLKFILKIWEWFILIQAFLTLTSWNQNSRKRDRFCVLIVTQIMLIAFKQNWTTASSVGLLSTSGDQVLSKDLENNLVVKLSWPSECQCVTVKKKISLMRLYPVYPGTAMNCIYHALFVPNLRREQFHEIYSKTCLQGTHWWDDMIRSGDTNGSKSCSIIPYIM